MLSCSSRNWEFSIIVLVLLFCFTDQAGALDIYAERNSVTAGDDSIVAVASGRSNVLIVYNEEGEKESYTIAQYSSYLYSSHLDLIGKIKREFPDGKKEIISSIAIAEYLFEQKNYSASAAMYSRAFNLAGKDARRYQRLVNMATASYYGSGRHVQGLEYLCSIYEGLPSWDYRYRHAIHAHLRDLAQKLGHNEARKRLDHIRQNPKCRRDDFSPVWIPISLRDMEWLAASRFTENNIYGFGEPEDRRFAEMIIKEGGHGFIDYLYFIIGDYRKIISDYPNSYVYDMALLMDGDNKDYEKAKASLKKYIEIYSKHSIKAVAKLYKRAIDNDDYKSIAQYKKEYGTKALKENQDDGKIVLQLNDHTRVWHRGSEMVLTGEQFDLLTSYYSECPELGQKLNSGEIVYVYDRITYYLNQHKNKYIDETEFSGWIGETDVAEEDYRLKCIADFNRKHLSFFTVVFQSIYQSLVEEDVVAIGENAIKLKICGDIREREINGLHEYSIPIERKNYCEEIFNKGQDLDLRGISFHKVAAAAFLEAYNLDRFNNSDKLFLAGLTFKNNNQFNKAKSTLERYIKYHSEERFADDALTEIGWIYLAVHEDPVKAQRYFHRVVEEYRAGNAYDNALNWLVISYRMTGQIIEAMKYAIILGQTIISERLRSKIGARDNELHLANSKGVENDGVFVFKEIISGESFFGESRVVVVERVPKRGSKLSVGTEIRSVDGESVTSMDQLFRVVNQKRQQGFEQILVNGETIVPLDSF